MITASIDNGRLYLGYCPKNDNPKCLGSSISLTPGLGTLPIKIYKQEYIVNKRSFIDHLQSIGLDETSVEAVITLGYNFFIEGHKHSLKVTEASLTESLNRFKKLVQAIDENDLKQVQTLFKIGACIDKTFYKGINATGYEQDVFEEEQLSLYTLCSYKSYNSALALATEKGYKGISQFLFSVKMNVHQDTITYIQISQNRKADGSWNTCREQILVKKVQVTTDPSGQVFLSLVET
jgi:hypothetical protein